MPIDPRPALLGSGAAHKEVISCHQPAAMGSGVAEGPSVVKFDRQGWDSWTKLNVYTLFVSVIFIPKQKLIL